MGDYLTKREPGADSPEYVFKVGTCDDWRYVRRSEAEAAHEAGYDAGEGTTLGVALAEPSILYRFPFPHDDADLAAFISGTGFPVGREMTDSVTLSVPGFVLEGVEHKRVCMPWAAGAYNGGRGCGNQRNYLAPCPSLGLCIRGEGEVYGWSDSIAPADTVPIEVVGERFGGERGDRTVFCCAWCGAWFSLGVGEVESVRCHIASTYSDNRWAEIMRRLRPVAEAVAA